MRSQVLRRAKHAQELMDLLPGIILGEAAAHYSSPGSPRLKFKPVLLDCTFLIGSIATNIWTRIIIGNPSAPRIQ
jgi:hypothetical protein